MPLPIENVLAAFPPSVKAGNVTLGPLSIGGAIRLAEIGVDARKTPVPKDKLFAAMDVLMQTRIEAPVKIGDVIVSDLCGTGVDVVAAESMA